jgi:superfamily II DNA/RNA helicase
MHVAVGTHPTTSQRAALAGGMNVVVGTPGRLAAHLAAGYLDAQWLHTLVLDEADALLDLGFEEVVERRLE